MAVGLAMVTASAAAQTPIHYKATPIGILDANPASRTVARALNERGEATGWSMRIDLFPKSEVFFFDEREGIRSLDTVFDLSEGWDINDAGEVAGHGYIDQAGHDDPYFLFRHSPETGFELIEPLFDRAEPYDLVINERGDMAGTWPISLFHNHAFRYTDERGLEDLGTFAPGDAEDSRAFAMNDAAEVVGWAWTGQRVRAFIDTLDEGMTPIALDPNDNQSFAYDINNASQVAGYSGDSSSTYHAFRYDHTDGTIEDLHGLLPAAAELSEGRFINERGDVAGIWRRQFGELRAFYYSDDFGMIDVGDLGPVSQSRGFIDINNRGEGVGIDTIRIVTTPFYWSRETGRFDIRDALDVPISDLLGDVFPLEINDAGQILVQTGFSWRGWLLTPNPHTLEVSPLVAGQMATFTVTGATPGKAQFVAYTTAGLALEGTPVPELGVALDLIDAQLVGSAVADATGTAIIERRIPDSARGVLVAFQAMQKEMTSNTVQQIVQ